MKNNLIIINYNDCSNTINLIEEASKLTSIEEIVVVDNKSTTNDLEILKQVNNSKLHIIALDRNIGYSGAINEGCKYLINKYQDCNIIVSNSDISIPSNKVIKSLAECLKNHTIAAVMPKILENGTFKYGWKLTSAFQDLITNIPLINKLYKNKFKYYDIEHFNNPYPVIDVLYGCFFMIKSSVLEKIDYFDSKVFLYYEENILAQKIKTLKMLTVVDTNVFVEHKHNATIGNYVSKLNKYKIYKESQIYYEEKYNQANKFVIMLFKIFFYTSLFIKNLILKLKKKA